MSQKLQDKIVFEYIQNRIKFDKEHNIDRYNYYGVYAILFFGYPIYIGKSKNLSNRLDQHRFYIDNTGSYNCIEGYEHINIFDDEMSEGCKRMYKCMGTYPMLTLGIEHFIIAKTDRYSYTKIEHDYIKKYQPPFNIQDTVDKHIYTPNELFSYISSSGVLLEEWADLYKSTLKYRFKNRTQYKSALLCYCKRFN